MLISSDVCLKVISHSVVSDSFMFMNCQLKMPSYLYGCRYWVFVVPVCVLSHFSRVQLFVTLCAVACLTSLFMGFSRQEYCSGLPCPSPGDLPNLGIKPTSSALAGGYFTTSTTWEASVLVTEAFIASFSYHRLPCW